MIVLVQAGGASAYSWPFKPFDQQHPIRGFFGDPRTVYENGILAGGFLGPGTFSFHQGIDISADKGRPVYATADGVVESAGYSGDYGNLVVLQHKFGLTTRYGHMSRFEVKTGQKVTRGDVIGYVGSTGRATGAHLHCEIRSNGKLLNPLQLLTQPPQR